ncbi:MAG TPA: VacJ family lipoprotein [Paucimonas sp.]|nr:VacJ family lipoprotein [Paucimonas sp.]
MSRLGKRISVLLLAFGLAGCAATPRNPQDPLEGFNRAMLTFNDKVDQVALKPAAEVYQSMLPSFVQSGVGNFFGNIADIPTLANQILQGKINESLSDFMRIAVNTTLGLGGLLDIASEANLPKHSEDFGQTLGRWGMAPGPYIVLPIFGPSTIRDTAALPVDLKADPWSHVYSTRTRNIGSVVRAIDQRSVALDASNLVEEAALDRYEFVRDAYLQRRESRVYDGEAPPKKRWRWPRAAEEGGGIHGGAVPVPEPSSEPVVETAQNASSASPAQHAHAPAAPPDDAPKISMSSDGALK